MGKLLSAGPPYFCPLPFALDSLVTECLWLSKPHTQPVYLFEGYPVASPGQQASLGFLSAFLKQEPREGILALPASPKEVARVLRAG